MIQGLTRANAGATIEILGLIGVPAVQHGNVIEVGTGVVGIDDACSGIRSFQATLMLSLFFGEIYRLTVRRRVVLCLLGFGLSFLFNVGRTTLLTWVAASKGIPAIANWHDPAGVTILVSCFVFLWLAAVWFARGKGEGEGERSGKVGRCEGGKVGRWEGGKVGRCEGGKGTTERRAAECAPYPPEQGGAGSPLRAAQAPSRFCTFPLSHLAGFLLPWVVMVEIGVEAWYRVHEQQRPAAPAWTVSLPRSNPTYQDLPLTEKTRQFLRYDEAQNGAWTEPDDWRVQAIYLRWNPGRGAVHLAKSHTPEVCLPAAGREVTARSGLRRIRVHGLELPFRAYTVRDDAGPLHVFYCLWEDRAADQGFETTKLTYGNRLAPVLAGRRNAGQRSLEIILRGAPDEAAAEARLAQVLEKVVKKEGVGR